MRPWGSTAPKFYAFSLQTALEEETAWFLRQKNRALRSALESVSQREVRPRKGRARGPQKDLGPAQTRLEVQNALSAFLWTWTSSGAAYSAGASGKHQSEADAEGRRVPQVTAPGGRSRGWGPAGRARAHAQQIVLNLSNASCFPSTLFLFVQSWPFLAGSACHLRRASNSRQPPSPRPRLRPATLLPSHWPGDQQGLIPAMVRVLKMSSFVSLRFSRI